MAAPLRAHSNGTEAAALGHPRALGSLSQRARAAVCPGWQAAWGRRPRPALGQTPREAQVGSPAAGGAVPAPAARLWLCGPLRLGVLGSCGEDEGLRALPGTRSVFGKWRLLLFMTLIAEEREPRRQNVLGSVRGPVDDPGLGGQTLGWGFTKAGTGRAARCRPREEEPRVRWRNTGATGARRGGRAQVQGDRADARAKTAPGARTAGSGQLRRSRS